VLRIHPTSIAVERSADVRPRRVLEQPALPYKPRQAPHRVRASAEAEHIDRVVRLVFLRQPLVAFLDDLIEPFAGDALKQAALKRLAREEHLDATHDPREPLG